jgi:hypothetical protein
MLTAHDRPLIAIFLLFCCCSCYPLLLLLLFSLFPGSFVWSIQSCYEVKGQAR